MTRKKKVSVRLNPHNYEFVRCIADTISRDKGDIEGNFSATLDLLLYLLRERSNFSDILKMVAAKGKYDRGIRTAVVLELKRQGEYFAKLLEEYQE